MIYLKKYLEQKVFHDLEDEEELKERLMTLKAVDATAAPGNKSLQLSEFVGEVVSYEKDANRFSVLKKRVHECRARNVTAVNSDFLESDPSTNENLQDIDLLLCDPSCSGSGMKLHSGLNGQKEYCTLEIDTPADQVERAQNLGKF